MLETLAPPQTLIKTGNSEIDKRIGGGLPRGSLTFIEGQTGSGKSVLMQQMVWGSLREGLRVAFYSSGHTTATLLRQMRSLALHVEDFFLVGALDIFPMPSTFSHEVSGRLYELLLQDISHRDADVFVLDSMTAFVTNSTEEQTFQFFSRVRALCDAGRSVVLTMHSYATSEQLLSRLRGMSDAHMLLRVEEIGAQLVKMLEVAKVRGAARTSGNIVSFDVEPNLGIRIIPISRAKL